MKKVEIVFPGRQQFELQPYEERSLGNHEVRGRTLATLISPGTELAWATGDNYPIRPGYSAVFEVDECGNDVVGMTRGERLFCMGAHRSSQQFDTRYALPVPAGMSVETAVIARLMGVSMTTLMTTTARPGDRVIICGAGPVGYLAAHLFRLAHYEVALVESDAKRRQQAEASGISTTYAAMPVDDPEIAGTVALVVDCSGHEQAVLDGCRVVRKRGEVVLVGVPWRRLSEIYAHEVLQAVFQNYAVLRSGWEWEVPLLARGFVWEELYEGYNNAPHSIFSGFKKALTWLSEGKIPLAGLVRKMSPEQPEKLYRALMRREFEEPFIVLDWTAL